MKGLKVQDDGAVHWFGDLVAFDSNIDFKGQTWGHVYYGATIFTGCSPAVVDVVFQDIMAGFMKHAFTRELPQGFLDLMAADLDGPLGPRLHQARSQARTRQHQGNPARALRGHRGIVPGLADRDVPGARPPADSVNIFVDQTVAHARAWDRVLAEWESARPAKNPFMYIFVYYMHIR